MNLESREAGRGKGKMMAVVVKMVVVVTVVYKMVVFSVVDM